MRIDVKMPKLGESLTEGTVLKWWKKVGDRVKKDETLLEVSTDKVDSEIPSPVDGVLVELVAQEQETVEIDAILARIETEASAVEQAAEQKVKKPAAQKQQTIRQKKPDKKPEKMVSPPESGLVDVIMPKLGESLTEGTILKWWKKPGDWVKKDETLLEVSTDKVDSEIPSPVDGVLQEILFDENKTVEVGSVIARVASAEVEEMPREQAKKVEAKPGSKKDQVQESQPKIPTIKEPSVSQKNKGSRFYSPLVLSIARKEGITLDELESLVGSGSGGRVSKKDILDYLEKKVVAAPTMRRDSSARIEIIPMDNVRKKIAQHMRQSLATSAHVYSVSECDMTAAMNIMYTKREEFQQQEGFKLTITPFILYAAIKALLDFPRVNASLEGDNIIEKKDINLGIAVAAPKGLIVPVVKNAEEKSFRGLARSVNGLVIKARDNKLTYNEIEGSTFSVTNYGIFGNIIGLPIINQPNVAIMGIGAIKKRPVVIESPAGDSIAIRSMCYLSMSYDHRLVDGELGGKFMRRIVEYLEQFKEDVP